MSPELKSENHPMKKLNSAPVDASSRMNSRCGFRIARAALSPSGNPLFVVLAELDGAYGTGTKPTNYAAIRRNAQIALPPYGVSGQPKFLRNG
jgi:hypothetical protein